MALKFSSLGDQKDGRSVTLEKVETRQKGKKNSNEFHFEQILCKGTTGHPDKYN